MEPVAERLSRHKPAGKFIDDDYLTVLHDVVHVKFEKGMRLKSLKYMVDQVDICRIVQVTGPRSFSTLTFPSSVE